MKIDKIVKIKKIELKSKRYDIEVENNHNFFANNILVHNCQNLDWSNFYQKYKDVVFYATEKLDGTSFSSYLNNGEFGVCSRKLNLLETDDNTYWKMARKFDIESKLKHYNYNIALQGEIIGEGIQGNKYALKGHDVYFFNIYDIDSGRYYNYDLFVETLIKFGLKMVPIISRVVGFKLLPTVQEMLDFATGLSELNNNIPREGIVIRPINELVDDYLGRLSFKVISNEFLIKYGSD